MDEFVSDRAYEVMDKKMLRNDFIEERGFKQFISPIKEVIEKRGRSLLCEHKSAGSTALVREFYSNMVGKKKNTCYVRGRWISFDKNEINKVLKLKDMKDGSKFKKLQKYPEHQKIVELLTVGKGEWKGTKKNPFDSIARGSLTKETKVWFYFLSSIMMPSKHLSTARKEEAVFL